MASVYHVKPAIGVKIATKLLPVIPKAVLPMKASMATAPAPAVKPVILVKTVNLLPAKMVPPVTVFPAMVNAVHVPKVMPVKTVPLNVIAVPAHVMKAPPVMELVPHVRTASPPPIAAIV